MDPYASAFDGADARPVPSPRGPQRLASLAGRAQARLQRGAQWLQSGEHAELRSDVEERIRARPLVAVTLALTAGFLLGRLLRD